LGAASAIVAVPPSDGERPLWSLAGPDRPPHDGEDRFQRHFASFHLTGKDAYDKAIDGPPELLDPPRREVVRMVEQGDVLMAELTGTVERAAGGEMRMSMAEVFVMRDGKIAERRARVIELKENAYR
jgi:predicted SnoaL-like aldol condensation-catalyzing enzyme